MRIIRFLDENDRICLGHEFDGNSAVLLEGDLFAELRDAGRRIAVKQLLAPLDPKAVLCIGLNYHRHAQETGLPIPDRPVLFMKNPAAVTGTGMDIILPRSCMDPPEVDYEAELAVIIGRAAKNVGPKQALDYIWGYTAANDVSARRWQKHGGAGQWVRGKSFDTFCPLGPRVLTRDEIPDPQNLHLECRLNGHTMQSAETADMIFPVNELIAFLSEDTTLLPGTVILTGTPSGVGFARTPPVYLMPGDVVEIIIDPIGALVNRVTMV